MAPSETGQARHGNSSSVWLFLHEKVFANLFQRNTLATFSITSGLGLRGVQGAGREARSLTKSPK